MELTPVVGRLPRFLLRRIHPPRTPLVNGVMVRQVSELGRDHVPSDPEVRAIAEMVAADPNSDPLWGETDARLIQASCALFASDKIRGPNKPPYHGKFLIGSHHVEWDALLRQYDRICILAARDHGKSAFFSLAYPIWKAGYNAPGSLGYIFSSTQPEAEKFLSLIKDELLENSEFTHLLPYTRDRFWSARKIMLRNGSEIRARGFGVKVRGGHPDWLVCDDVLDDEDIYSETIRRRNIDYFLSAIANMVPMDGKSQLVVVGTPFNQADLYAALKDNGEYAYRVYPAINAKGELLFPQRYSEQSLARKRRELKSEARFAREFLCRPLSDESSLFPSKLFEGSDVRLPYTLGLGAAYWERRGCMRYTGVDIAMSAETGGDYFVIFTVAVDQQGNRWVANIIREKGWGFHRQIDAIKDEYYLMRPEIIHIEANQMQRVWTDEIAATTDIPVRKFFTTGVGGRQPLSSWKKGATSISVNKNHIDRGVPGMRITLEHRKWRIPRGDERSIELTDFWIGEMGAIGWINGKVQSVGSHDDVVMSSWMCETAVQMGGARLDLGDSPLAEERLLPVAGASSLSGSDNLEKEKRAVSVDQAVLAALQQGQPIPDSAMDRDGYVRKIRRVVKQYAEERMNYGEFSRAKTALQELSRLDSVYQIRSYEVDFIDSGDSDEYREGHIKGRAPTPEDLGIYTLD